MRVVTLASDLGLGAKDGEQAVLQVSTTYGYGRARLTFDQASGKWIGRSVRCLAGTDGGFINAAGRTEWTYAVPAADLGKNMLRAGSIPFCGAFYQAGLQLQDRLSGRIQDNGGLVIAKYAAWYYEYNNTDLILFSNDQSAQAGKTWNGGNDQGFAPSMQNVGHGAVLYTDGSGVIRQYSETTYDDDILTGGYHALPARNNGGWDYVKYFVASQPVGAALGGVPTAVAYTPTKHWLYPTIYCKNTLGNRGMAACTYEVRWTT